MSLAHAKVVTRTRLGPAGGCAVTSGQSQIDGRWEIPYS